MEEGVGMDDQATTSSSEREDEPHVEEKVVAQRQRKLVKMKGTGKAPVVVEVPKGLRKAYPVEAPYVIQVVDEVKKGGKRGEVVWCVSPGFSVVGKVNGKIGKAEKISDIELVAVQTVVKNREESSYVVIKYREHTGDESTVLHLKKHRYNTPIKSLEEILQVLATVYYAVVKTPLVVERLPHDLDFFDEPALYGPFTSSRTTQTVKQKVKTTWEQQPSQPPTQSGATTTNTPLSALLNSPLGHGAAAAATSTKWNSHIPPPHRAGAYFKIRTTNNPKWRIGQVVSCIADGTPSISVGRSQPALIYPFYEPISPVGSYTTRCPTRIIPELQHDGGSNGVDVEQGRGLMISHVEDYLGEAWGMLDSGGWVMFDDIVKDEDPTTPPPVKLHVTYGLNPGAFGNPEIRDLDIGEVPEHHGIGNAVEERPSVKVVLRVRPLNPKEIENGERSAVVAQSPTSVVCRSYCYNFDAVLNNTPQVKVLQAVLPGSLRRVLSGRNATIFAYGASGSGKTHTMLGSHDTPGIVQAGLSEIVKAVCRDECGFTVRLSFFELYDEKVKDLLAVATADSVVRREAANVFRRKRVRSHPVTGPYIEEMTQIDAMREDVPHILEKAKSVRATSSTHGNPTSSRSHAVVGISLVRNAHPAATMLASTLTVVDLAGSERVRRYRDDRVTEAKSINLSLTVLRKVIDALLKPDVGLLPPYRESMLTYLLSESLGGNSYTTLLATVAGGSNGVDDTVATLRYASRARGILNNIKSNCVSQVVEGLAVTSPHAAKGLCAQSEVVSEALNRFGSHEREEEAVVLYNAITANPQQGASTLETIIQTVRDQERESVKHRMSPIPPSPGRVSPSPPTPEMVFSSEDIILEKLAKALASSAARMLSPSIEPEPQRMPSVVASPPPQPRRVEESTSRNDDNNDFSYDLMQLPSTRLVGEMGTVGELSGCSLLKSSIAVTPGGVVLTPNSMRFNKSVKKTKELLGEELQQQDEDEIVYHPEFRKEDWSPLGVPTLRTPPKLADPIGYGLLDISPPTPPPIPHVPPFPTPPRPITPVSMSVPPPQPGIQGISYMTLPVKPVEKLPMTRAVRDMMYAPLRGYRGGV